MTGYSAYESGFSFLRKTIRLYEQPGFFLVLAAAGLFLIILLGMQSGRLFLAFPTVFFFLTVLNPFVFPAFIRGGAVSGEDYYRLLWLIPYGMLVAFGTITLAYRIKKGLPRNIFYLAVLALLGITAVPSLKTMADLRLPSDIYMTDEQLQMVCNYIIDESGIDEPEVAFDNEEYRLSAREYSAALRISHLFEDAGDTASVQAMNKSLRAWHPDFIVVRKESDAASYLDELGMSEEAYTREYLVYRHT